MVGAAQRDEQEQGGLAIWDEIVDSLATLIKTAPPTVAIPAAQKYQQIFTALEVTKLAEHKRAGASERETRATASAGGTRSKKAALNTSKRVDAVNENPALADDVERGELGEEQLDVIAHASDKSDGDAARDASLLDEVKNAPPDEAGKITNPWLERRDDDAAKTR
jgi:hypothetical protein